MTQDHMEGHPHDIARQEREADAALAEPTPTRVTQWQVDGEDGEGYVRYSIYAVPKNWGAQDIVDWCADNFPPEYCRHEYDCCGHYYARRGRVTKVAGGGYSVGTFEVLVRQGFSQNI